MAIRAFCPFRLVADEDLAQLHRETAMSHASAGSTLFEEGDPADGVAAVLEGHVEVAQARSGARDPRPGIGARRALRLHVLGLAHRDGAGDHAGADGHVACGRRPGRLARHERLATAIVADMAFVLAERLDRRTEDVVSLLRAAGSRLPVAELERFRSRAVE